MLCFIVYNLSTHSCRDETKNYLQMAKLMPKERKSFILSRRRAIRAMITSSFNQELGKIFPRDIYPIGKQISDVCIVTFSRKLMEKIRQEYDLHLVATMTSTTYDIPIYSLLYKGTTICLYNSFMGSTLAGTCMIEASALVGASKFIMFGSCGRLYSGIENHTFIVPTRAYRDEGFSYHYAPVSDYIAIKNHDAIEKFLGKNNINFVAGKTWTTDAFYKETETEIKQRKKEGCIAVEMECAGCQAVADFYHWDFYEFFFGGDLLDAKTWDKATLGSDSDKERHHDIFQLALDFSLSI